MPILGVCAILVNMFRGISTLIIVTFLAGISNIASSSAEQHKAEGPAMSLGTTDSTQISGTISSLEEKNIPDSQAGCQHPCTSGCQTHCHFGHCQFLVSDETLGTWNLFPSGRMYLGTLFLSSVYLASDTKPPRA